MPENCGAEAKRQRGRTNRLALLLLALLSPLVLLNVLLVGVARLIGALVLHLLTLTIWIPVGRRVLFVYSDSPVWKVHIETEVLPRLPTTAAVLNWSERSRWSPWSLSVRLFRYYAGTTEYNPLGIVVHPLLGPKVFRFWRAFRDAKQGKHEPLRALEARFFKEIGVS